jgi:hypothetical protein
LEKTVSSFYYQTIRTLMLVDDESKRHQSQAFTTTCLMVALLSYVAIVNNEGLPKH